MHSGFWDSGMSSGRQTYYQNATTICEIVDFYVMVACLCENLTGR